MAEYYVDDGGDNTTGASWATAYTSLSALDDAIALAAGDIVYIGHDHVCQYAHAANRTITGPASGIPCAIISVTQGSNPPTYQKSSSNQIDTSEGAYDLTFAGALALYGICSKPGYRFASSLNSDEAQIFNDCTIKFVSATGKAAFRQFTKVKNLTLDFSNQSAPSAGALISSIATDLVEINGLTIVDADKRTGYFSYNDYNDGGFKLSGADLSGLPAGLVLFYNPYGGGRCEITNCKMPSTWAVINDFPSITGTNGSRKDIFISNCGSANAPEFFAHVLLTHILVSSAAIYRTGGASINEVATSWFLKTSSFCNKYTFAATPWIYGEVTAGSKTFDLFVTNDTADLTNQEAWLEVEFLGTSGSPLASLASNRAANILATAAAHTDDTTSTWNGTGPAFTYKQKLSVSATVAIAGLYRARLCVAKEIASSAYLYIDPKVVVS